MGTSKEKIAARENGGQLQGAPIPSSFGSYVRSMGPGIVVVLTWLGAGDIVNSAAAGGNYGYALMWIFVLCLIFRYLFNSIVAKYQLMNQHGESILGGLARLHWIFPPFVLISTLLLAHAVEIYLLTGAASALGHITGFGNIRLWAVLLSLAAFLIAFRPLYRRLEKVFYVMAGILTACFIGLAVWSKPSLTGIFKGVFAFAMPPTVGRYDASFLMLSIVGAVAGSLGNLIYPYFMREKGWVTPAHRKVQRYDLIFGIIVLIILDLSVWVVGAEILHPRGIRVVDISSLAMLLGEVLGRVGTLLFYIGIFAALFGNAVGTASAYTYLAADAFYYTRSPEKRRPEMEYRHGSFYRYSVIWILFSPLVWILLGKTEFVALTILVNAAQTLLIPLLVVGIWLITARAKYIGLAHRNKWWENLAIALLLVVGCVSSVLTAMKLLQ